MSEPQTENRQGWLLFDDRSRYVDRFGLLLILATAAVIILSLVDLKSADTNLRSSVAQLIVTLFVGGTLLVSLRASGVGRRLRIVADIAILVGILVTTAFLFAVEVSDNSLPFSDGNVSAGWVVISMLAPVLVVRRLIHHERATLRTLVGALSAYLLIALAFNFAYLEVDAHGSGPFFGSDEPSTSFMYYSLVTITTLGYGDLSAAQPFGRLLSTIEAVVGQVYLVTFVAMIVGLLAGQRERLREGLQQGPRQEPRED